ncbi:MAG: GMC family oxidoreductase [Acidobacteria bacterium]|nr:GMC family oxidoreductase [Acidobacteriota bacterium]
MRVSLDVDWAVVGSGFGGSVAAMRLAQKGYRVTVFEAGRRFAPEDLPVSSWDARRFWWAPALGCYGIQRIDLLRHVTVLGGAGVGGGSLVYGNTLFVPLEPFFEREPIREMGGRDQLMPWFELARRMLGVVENPRLFEPDELLRRTAAEYGREESFAPSPVGVFFGEEGCTVPDPYFGGEGPERTGCNFCGGCFIGCRVGAKNTLDRNYLYFAERLGARVVAETEVMDIRPLSEDGGDGYELSVRPVRGTFRRPVQRIRAGGIVVAAGVLGTVRLLGRLRQDGRLPRLSARLGSGVRTNSETIVGVMARDFNADYSRGIAASSSVFPDEHTQIQADRYPAGSDAMGLMATILTDGGGKIPRPLRWLGQILRHPVDYLRVAVPLGFARRSVILVVMQDLESSLRLSVRRRAMPPFGHRLSSELENGSTIPTWIPIANDFARRLARRMDAIPGNMTGEVLLNRPTTAHILGGCCMGRNPGEGAIDLENRAFGYRNLLVCDGSVIPANLGVNPALSITAFAERAMSFVPPKGGAAPRLFPFEHRWGAGRLLTRSGRISAPEPAHMPGS